MAYSPPANVSGTVGMFDWINSTTNNWLFPGIIITAFMIIIGKQLSNPQNTFAKSFSSASFLCMIASVFARILGFVDTTFMTVFILMTGAGVIWMHKENS